MSTAPLSLPLDPVLIKFNKFLANEQGRDKLNKIIQYGSRFMMAYYLEKEGAKSANAASWRKMFVLTADCRKILRLFKFLAEYEKVAKIVNALNGPPNVKQLIQVIGFIGLANYWLWDNLVWLAKGDRLNMNAAWAKRSMKGWWVGITAQLIVDTMSVIESIQREQKAKASALPSDDLNKVIKTETAVRQNLYQYSYTKNIADWIIAANGGDLITYVRDKPLSDKTVGLLGVISGLAVCTNVWKTIP